MTNSYTYDVFGAIRSQTGSSPNEFKFTGEQVDATGMEDLRARYYDQATGRFLSQDAAPVLDRYLYVGNQPVNFVDPAGNCRIEVRLTKVGGAGFRLWKAHGGFAWWHAYIVTFDEIDGSEKVYRGGPSGDGGLGGLLTKVSGRDDESDDGGKFGYLRAHRRHWDKNATDWDKEDDDPRAVVLDNDLSCSRWRRSFDRTIGRINEARIPYHPLRENSNAVVRELLDAAPGVDPDKPDGHTTPGWGTPLEYEERW